MAHPTGGKPSVVGEVYSSLEEMLVADSGAHQGEEACVPVRLRSHRLDRRRKLGKLLTERGITWMYGRARLEDRQAVLDDIKRSKCTHVLNAAG